MRPKVIPVMLFPGDWCVRCIDQQHPGIKCWRLDMTQHADGTVTVAQCGCENSVPAGRSDGYVIRVTEMQKE